MPQSREQDRGATKMLEALLPTLEESYRSVVGNYLRKGDESHLSEAYEIGYEALESGYSLAELINVHSTALSAWIKQHQGTFSITDVVNASGRLLLQLTAPFTMLQVSQSEGNSALRRLNALFEESENRFAHVLHDDAAQVLSVAYLELSQLRNEVPDSARARIDRLTSYLDQTCEQLRHMSHELRPPMLEHLGLIPTLHNLADGFKNRYGLEVILQSPDIERAVLRELESPLYRAVHEGLTNIVRHAHAQYAWITLEIASGRVDCTIRDDGAGFEPDLAGGDNPEAGLGLVNLRERIALLQGTLNVESSPGNGTCLHISIPLTV